MKSLRERILVLSTIFVSIMMALSPMALAPSHPVDIDPETGETIDTLLDHKWADAGVTSGFFHTIDIWWEGVTDVPPEEQLAERLSEAHVELTAGDVETAQNLLKEAEPLLAEVEATVEATAGESENFEEYAEHTETAVTFDEELDALAHDLEQAIATGAVAAEAPAVEAVEASLDDFDDETAELEQAVADLREEIVDDIAEDQGVTHIEAENTLETQEVQEGVATVHELAVQDELKEVGEELTALREEIDTAQAAGEAVDTATLQLLHEATARFEHAQEAFEDGSFGEALGQLTACERITENAEDHLEEKEPLEIDPAAIRAERTEEVRQFIEEVRSNPALLAANPEFEDNMEIFADELEIEETITELLAAAPAEEVYEAASFELSHTWGTDYIPPVFTETTGETAPTLAEFETADLQTAGGFVEAVTYVDPANDYTYEFTDEGYMYTTPFGIEHELEYPDEFTIPDSFSKGTEEYTYTAPDGSTLAFTALGHSITTPAGRTDDFAYALGEHDLAGGHGSIVIDPQGVTVTNERGREESRLEYVPEFSSYVHVEDGTVFSPESAGITSVHDAAIKYDQAAQAYVFDPEKAADYFSKQYERVGLPASALAPASVVAHDKWAYDPVTNMWANEKTGESHVPQATMVAPVGHESKESFSTEHGEVWAFDAATNTWTSDKGESFVAGEKGHAYGEYQDVSGKTYDYSHGGVYTDPGTGVGWSYDASTQSWTSGTTGTGTTAGAPTGSVAPSTGTAVDAGGNVWSYDAATGSWSSPTATEGQHTEASAPPPGTDTGGTAPSGGDTGGSTGGDTGGSAPSGGDADGHAGYIVREIRPAKDLHPVTRFLLRYLGITR